MSYNGSGTFLINTAGQPVVSGTVISSTAFNSLTADLATGLSTAITKDGQTTVTANIPMSTYKFTGLGVGSAATDSANLSQVQSTVTKLLNSVSGADTITATASPTLAAYATGQMFYFVAAGDNTTSVTLNIDSLGAKAVTRDGSVALAAADIKSGEVVVVVYDGTRFQVVSQLNSAGDARFANVSIASSLYVGGVSTFVGNAGFSANVSIASALSVGGVAAITGATTIGGNLTLSGGTANGVLYLNGSKVATSGSALVFDGTNFGVGTSNPAAYGLLAISGASAGAHVNASSGAASFKLYEGGAGRGAVTSLNGSDGLAFLQGTTEGMRLTSTSLYTASGINVGIGTSSPVAKLQVKTQTNANAAFQNSTSVAGGVKINCFNDAGSASSPFELDGSTLQFNIASTERMRLDSSGNLGIGTTSPSYKLQVAGTSGTVALGLTGTHASGDIGLYIVPSAITGSYNAINSAPSATTGVNYSFGNANNSSATADSRADIYTTSASGGDPKLTLSISGVRNWSVGVDNSASDQFCISASDAPGNTDRLTIDTNGNATIGAGSVATNATDGFLYVPTCAGTPTGTPTAKSGYAPIVVNTTNNKLYFYSGGAWRDAGP